MPPSNPAPKSSGSWDPTKHPRVAKGVGGGEFSKGSWSAAPTNAKPVGQGQSGDEVRQLQARLNQFGVKVAVDGQFGPQTRAAVEQFQKTHKDANGNPLKVDGLVGPRTTEALRQQQSNLKKIAVQKRKALWLAGPERSREPQAASSGPPELQRPEPRASRRQPVLLLTRLCTVRP
jgi:peptidoglycan hydrolase-like protein with peptidoglycan-binding domain